MQPEGKLWARRPTRPSILRALSRECLVRGLPSPAVSNPGRPSARRVEVVRGPRSRWRRCVIWQLGARGQEPWARDPGKSVDREQCARRREQPVQRPKDERP